MGLASGRVDAPGYQPGYWDQFEAGGTATVGGAPGAVRGGSEDPQAVFNELMSGKPITVETMQAIGPELQRRTGARLEPNARGNAYDLVLPSGQFVDVVQAFEGPEAGRRLQWAVQDTYSDGNGGWYYPGYAPGVTPPGAAGGGLPAGMQTGTFTGGGAYPLSSFMGPGLLQPWTTPFGRPTLSEETDPGYMARMDMGRQAIERSHSAKGTLRTGALLKDLMQYGQDYGSSEYDKVYNRSLGEYQMAHGIYDRNQANQFNRLSSVASMGQNAAAGMGNAASSYANNVGDLYTQQGNANAAAGVAGSNAWTGAINNMGNLGMMLAQYYATQPPPQPSSTAVAPVR